MFPFFICSYASGRDIASAANGEGEENFGTRPHSVPPFPPGSEYHVAMPLAFQPSQLALRCCCGVGKLIA
jgi:hypothetical protein